VSQPVPLPALQCVAQAPLTHVEYPPGQGPVVPLPQLPLPSHMAAEVSRPLLQLALPHWVVAEACSHVWLEVQFPVLPQVPLGPHWPWGAGLPAVTGWQLPSD
jgi:hypothetical protein